MAKAIEAWACEHCPKVFRIKGNAVRHEQSCLFNIATRACCTCDHATYHPALWHGSIKTTRAWWECTLEIPAPQRNCSSHISIEKNSEVQA